MKERRRAPRALLKCPISTMQSYFVLNGTIVDISEYGVRYSRPTIDPENTEEIYQEEIGSITIQTVHFLLPTNNNFLQLVCHVIKEKFIDDKIETSCEFLGITNKEKQAIRTYVDQALS